MAMFETSFYNQTPLRSPQDYEDEYARADERKNRAQINALALQTGQYDLQEKIRANREQEQIRSKMSSLPPNADIQTRVNALRSVGAWNQADALEKTGAEIERSRAASAQDLSIAEKNKAEMAHNLYGYLIKELQSATSPEEARSKMDLAASRYGFPPDMIEREKQNVPNEPEKFLDWKASNLRSLLEAKDQLPKFQEVKAGGKTELYSVDPVTGKPTLVKEVEHTVTPDTIANNITSRANNADTNATSRANNAATNATSRANNANTVGATIRGQNMVDARARSHDIQVKHGVAALTPQQQAALSKAVGEGRLDINRINSKTAPLLADLAVANPDMDFAKVSSDIQLNRNANFRSKAMTAEALPEIMDNFAQANKKLDYSKYKPVGDVQALYKKYMNDPDYVSAMVQRNDALMSIASVMRGVGMTDQAHRAEMEVTSPSMDPRATDAWLQAQKKALEPRLKRIQKITRENPTKAANPKPMPSKKAEMVKGEIYQTPKGIARWDGNNFVQE